MLNDELHVVHARAAGLDVHKMEITATVRLCVNAGEPSGGARRVIRSATACGRAR